MEQQKTQSGWTEWIQASRRQRPLLKGVPRQWRGMYTAGGASTNVDSAYKDFWNMFPDTYPPASPYPSKRGDSRWQCACRHVVEDRQIWDYGTLKNTKKELVTIGDYSAGNRCLLQGWMIMTKLFRIFASENGGKPK